jgi:DNA-binding transcriptional MerR regulator
MHYSIQYLEEISGIKAHTIRIWEQRYNLLKPKRTASNIRYYDDSQLRKILNVTVLLDLGYKISHIADMSDAQMYQELKKNLDEETDVSVTFQQFTNELIVSSLNFDKISFEKQFNSCVLKFGFAPTIEKVLYPTMKRIGVLWQMEEMNPSQEHFISNLVRQKLYSAIDGLPEPVQSSKKCLLFLPENEHHEIGLLYFNYLLLRSGIKTIYLGEDVPLNSVKHATDHVNPSHIVLFMVKATSAQQTNDYLAKLCKQFSNKPVLLSGSPTFLQTVKKLNNLVLIDSPEASKKYFKMSF